MSGAASGGSRFVTHRGECFLLRDWWVLYALPDDAVRRLALHFWCGE